MRVVVNRDRCDGQGVCAFEAPAVFAFDESDEIVVLHDEPPPEEHDRVRAAARTCPKHAITVDHSEPQA